MDSTKGLNSLFEYESLQPLAARLHGDFVKYAYIILAFFFLCTLIQEFLLRFRNQGDLFGVIYRLIICTIILANSIPVRNFIYDNTLEVANEIYSVENESFNIPYINIEGVGENSKSLWGILRENFIELICFLITAIMKGLYALVVFVIDFARKIGHFLILVLSPFAIVFYISQRTENIAIGFFKQFLSLCLWPVFISVIYKIVTTILNPNFAVNYSVNTFLETIAFLVILTVLLWKVPSFSSQFVSGSMGVFQKVADEAVNTIKSIGFLGAGLIGGAAIMNKVGLSGKALSIGNTLHQKGRKKIIKAATHVSNFRQRMKADYESVLNAKKEEKSNELKI